MLERFDRLKSVPRVAVPAMSRRVTCCCHHRRRVQLPDDVRHARYGRVDGGWRRAARWTRPRQGPRVQLAAGVWRRGVVSACAAVDRPWG
jgi:hypothetical protein